MHRLKSIGVKFLGVVGVLGFGILGISNSASGVDSLEPVKLPREPSPVIRELKLLTTISDVTTGLVAIKSLKEFTKVRNSRLAQEAKEALKELEQEAKKWAGEFIHKEIKSSITFKDVVVERSKLRLLHLLEPESLAFVDVPSLDDLDVEAFNMLPKLENLTIQGCRHFTGFGFRNIKMPDLKILHLNGSRIIDEGLWQIDRKRFPKLVYLDLRGTNVSQESVEAMKKHLSADGRKIQIKFDK